jgi:hypothetical protein
MICDNGTNDALDDNREEEAEYSSLSNRPS